MKVLHLPYNIASQISATVHALNAVGVEARGLVRENASVQDASGITDYPSVSRRKRPVAGLLRHVQWELAVLRAIRWADVIHWYFARTCSADIDLKLARKLGKPGIVEFWGSDIRVPEEEAKVNPYFAALGSDYEYNWESREGSYDRQEKFVRHGFTSCLAVPELGLYLKPGLWKTVYRSRSRVMTSDIQPAYPVPEKKRVVLAHSPTARVCKGTAAVERAVEKLKHKYDIEYRLIEGMPYARAKEAMRGADLFLDQFVLGSYGLSTVEAMALGKPVVCYIRASVASLLPKDCPVINANQDNLAEVIEPYLQDGALRYETGIRSRRFAETHHDACIFARELTTIYEALMEEKQRPK